MKFKINRSLYPFDSRFLKLSDGTLMHYVDEGNGPVILMLHGNPTWSFLYRNMVLSLKSDFRCIAPDLSGFGLSESTQDFDFKAQSHANHIVEFVEQMDLKKIIIIGQDWGGPIGLNLAINNPNNILGLVMGNTWAWPLKGSLRFELFSSINGGLIGQKMAFWFNGVWKVFMAMGFHTEIHKSVRNMYAAPFIKKESRKQTSIFPRELVKAYSFETYIEDNIPTISKIPILLLWGKYDFAFKVKALEKFQSLFKNQQTVHLDAGHYWQEDDWFKASRSIQKWAETLESKCL